MIFNDTIDTLWTDSVTHYTIDPITYVYKEKGLSEGLSHWKSVYWHLVPLTTKVC